jgi:hypothetical protein
MVFTSCLIGRLLVPMGSLPVWWMVLVSVRSEVSSFQVLTALVSWNMWPDGPENITTTADEDWADWLSSAGKSYMMGR